MPEPIEELYVVIGSDISKLLKETKEGIAKVEKELAKMGKNAEKESDKVNKKFEKMGNIVSGIAAGLATAAVAIVGFFTKIGASAVKANSEFEVFTTQFETLLGSAEAAQKRLKELTQFGIETPFELNEIVEASRVLQVFGGDILATGDNLRMIGDIAAGVNQPFKDVATWVGRMYDAMQSGRPFGEASARLQEMGALSGKARAELEKMQKQGASGAELWAKFNELVGSRFAGNMERLSGTLQGITSNLVDFKDNLQRIGGAKLFDQIKEDAKDFLDTISEKELNGAIEGMAKALGSLIASLEKVTISDFVKSFQNIDPQTLNMLSESLNDAAMAIEDIGGLEANLNGIIEELSILLDTFTIVLNIINKISVALPNLSSGLKDFVTPFGMITGLAEDLEKTEISDWFREQADASETSTQAIKKEMDARKAGLQALYAHQKAEADATKTNDDFNDSIEETISVSEAAAKAIDSYGSELLDLQEDTAQKSVELEQEHAQALTDIQDEYTDSLADAEKERTKAMADAEADRGRAIVEAGKQRAEDIADLEKDIAKQREDVVEGTRKDLAKLQKDTDRTLKEEQDNFNKDELRETEDHLTSLRQLRQQYLDSIDDAVKSRDARALVDAKKRYNEEKAQQEDAFKTNQGRAREDQDQRLQQIRDEESRRAEEIMKAQEEELQNLVEAEAEKRAEIEKSYSEQLQKADEAYAEAAVKAQAAYQKEATEAQIRREEAKAKEEENYQEEKAQIDEQIAERLEQIAKGLADQDDITDEEAKNILETFAKYFGADGEIEKLMADFANRRRAKLEIQVAYQAEGTTVNYNPGGGSGPNYNPYSANVPSFAGGGSMFANRPTLVQFGEVPEMATFTPLSKVGGRGPQRVEVDLKMSGSAPPGIRSSDRDAIASVLLNALQEAGFDRASGGRGQ